MWSSHECVSSSAGTSEPNVAIMQTRLAAESEARYGRRFRMQDLDKAMATVRSGLLQVPTLVLSL